MIVVPFIYFGLLAFFLYKRRKEVDMAFLICCMYAATSFFGILGEVFGMRSLDNANYHISIGATFTYCALLTICLVPMIMFSNKRIKHIAPIRNGDVIKIVAYVGLAWFALTVLLSFSSFIGIVTGDFGELRNALYRGEAESGYLELIPSPWRLILVFFNMIFGCPWIMVFLAFFSTFIQKSPRKFFWYFMIISLSGPWMGVLNVDRSKTTYWIISFFVIYEFFLPFMEQSARKQMKKLLFVLAGVGLLYITIVTNSRFGDMDVGELTGSGGGVISYLGQNFINFCYFFDTFHSPWTSLNLIFPWTSRYILGQEVVGGVEMQHFLTETTGVQTGVFYTYLGQILITAGALVMVIYCIVYCLVSIGVLSNVKKKITSPMVAYMYLFLSSIMFLGLFVHYYASAVCTFSVVFFFFVFKIAGKGRIMNKYQY